MILNGIIKNKNNKTKIKVFFHSFYDNSTSIQREKLSVERGRIGGHFDVRDESTNSTISLTVWMKNKR